MRAGTVDRALVAVAALALTLLAAYAVSGRHRFSGPLLFPVTPSTASTSATWPSSHSGRRASARAPSGGSG